MDGQIPERSALLVERAEFVLMRWLILLLTLSVLGCPSAAESPATIATITADGVYHVLADRYTAAGLAIIEHAKSRAEAESELATLRESWKPTWAAYDAAADAIRVWRAASRGDELLAAMAARDAYCRLRKVSPAALPAFPGGCP